MSYSVQNLFLDAATVTRSTELTWEEVNCLLCNSSRRTTLLEAQDVQGETFLWFPVVQCQDCGLCYLNPRPQEEQLGRFYPSNYRPHQVGPEKEPTALRALLGVPKRGKQFIPWRGQGRLLDFGCGSGGFLRQMRAQGWHVTGLDVSEATVEQLRQEPELNVLHGSLPHPRLEPGSFDVITMWHSLEHVADPRQTLLAARELLQPNGQLLVAVPNIDSLAFRTFGQHWFGLDVPRHLTHFAPWTLQLLLERTGYRVEKISMLRKSAWLRHSARRACVHPQATWLHKWMKGKFLSRLIAFYGCLTYQSDVMLVAATPDRG